MYLHLQERECEREYACACLRACACACVVGGGQKERGEVTKIHGRKGIYGRSKRRVRKLEAGEMDEDDFFGMGKHYHIPMFEINLERAHDIGQEGEDLDSGERGGCPRRTSRESPRGRGEGEKSSSP